MTNVNEIRESLTLDQYQVDSAAVAQALVERLLAGRASLLPPSAR